MKSKCLSIFLSLFVTMFQHLSKADNWGHWRGPTGNGVAQSAHPPVQWSSTKNVKWKAAIPGRGSGSPIIWKNRVFVVTAVPINAALTVNESAQKAKPKLLFKILCFEGENGQLLWEKTATEAIPHQRTHKTHGYASASPCTDGEHVYAYYRPRRLGIGP
jgi:outer membrane protein assembly factor BamB